MVKETIAWAWIDTCCIDKRSSAELSEAINSMYRWYSESQVCYVYLDDVWPNFQAKDTISRPRYKKFEESRWFTRGWTLQELLAPSSLVFFDRSWTEIGTKLSLLTDIIIASGISNSFLEDPRKATVAQKMSWASGRETTRIEDMSYCMLGLFGVNMPLLYGEGANAFKRLQEEIIKLSTDQSIFAWEQPRYPSRDIETSSILARSPGYFEKCSNIMLPSLLDDNAKSYSITNQGLSIELPYLTIRDIEIELGHTLPLSSGQSIGQDLVAAFLDCTWGLYGPHCVIWLRITKHLVQSGDVYASRGNLEIYGEHVCGGLSRSTNIKRALFHIYPIFDTSLNDTSRRSLNLRSPLDPRTMTHAIFRGENALSRGYACTDLWAFETYGGIGGFETHIRCIDIWYYIVWLTFHF